MFDEDVSREKSRLLHDLVPVVLAVAAVPRLAPVAERGVVVKPHLDVRGVRRDCDLERLRLQADDRAFVGHADFPHHAPVEVLPAGVKDHPHVYVPDLRAVRTLPALRQARGVELDDQLTARLDLAVLALLPANEELKRGARLLLVMGRRGRWPCRVGLLCGPGSRLMLLWHRWLLWVRLLLRRRLGGLFLLLILWRSILLLFILLWGFFLYLSRRCLFFWHDYSFGRRARRGRLRASAACRRRIGMGCDCARPTTTRCAARRGRRSRGGLCRTRSRDGLRGRACCAPLRSCPAATRCRCTTRRCASAPTRRARRGRRGSRRCSTGTRPCRRRRGAARRGRARPRRPVMSPSRRCGRARTAYAVSRPLPSSIHPRRTGHRLHNRAWCTHSCGRAGRCRRR